MRIKIQSLHDYEVALKTILKEQGLSEDAIKKASKAMLKIFYHGVLFAGGELSIETEEK